MSVVAGAVARVPGTCGELLQGVDADGPLLVSLPVQRYGTVRVELLDSPEMTVTPALPHAVAAAQLAVERAGWRRGVRVELGGELPHARGMGSSTADVAGVIGGVCGAAGVALSQPELVALMTQVEPSDSSPLRGLWAIDHVRGSRAVRLGPVPATWFLAAVDTGEPVATLDMHRACGAGPRLPDDVLTATPWRDADSVARVATESAVRNQQRLAHPAFDVVRDVAEQVGAPGICVAHSGSLCAVIGRNASEAYLAREELQRRGLQAEFLRAFAPGMRVRVTTAAGTTTWLARP